MRAPNRRFVLFFVPAAIVLAALSLACGAVQGTAVPECENAVSGDECGQCCSRNGYSGNLFNSFDTPRCECM